MPAVGTGDGHIVPHPSTDRSSLPFKHISMSRVCIFWSDVYALYHTGEDFGAYQNGAKGSHKLKHHSVLTPSLTADWVFSAKILNAISTPSYSYCCSPKCRSAFYVILSGFEALYRQGQGSTDYGVVNWEKSEELLDASCAKTRGCQDILPGDLWVCVNLLLPGSAEWVCPGYLFTQKSPFTTGILVTKKEIV